MMIFIPCQPSQDRRSCTVHGGPIQRGMCLTGIVLESVAEERHRQFARYGTNERLEDGTGPDVAWLPYGTDAYVGATVIEREMRQDYEDHEAQHGAPTWMHLVREEVAEAFKESDPARLTEELIQVAALCVSWVEKLVSRQLPSPPKEH